uniref:Uncharacterized protein n=1 Tax=Knipowitschia caucasica TaxID=637954 RepID=A0AAV2JCN6_KNICA
MGPETGAAKTVAKGKNDTEWGRRVGGSRCATSSRKYAEQRQRAIRSAQLGSGLMGWKHGEADTRRYTHKYAQMESSTLATAHQRDCERRGGSGQQWIETTSFCTSMEAATASAVATPSPSNARPLPQEESGARLIMQERHSRPPFVLPGGEAVPACSAYHMARPPPLPSSLSRSTGGAVDGVIAVWWNAKEPNGAFFPSLETGVL